MQSINFKLKAYGHNIFIIDIFEQLLFAAVRRQLWFDNLKLPFLNPTIFSNSLDSFF